MNEKQEWQLSILKSGEIIVEHRALPRFNVQIIIHAGQPEPCVTFKPKWMDAKPAELEMNWYMKALDFYINAPKEG